MSENISVTKPDPNSRTVVETKSIKQFDGTDYIISEESFGDRQIAIQFRDAEKDVNYWDSIDPYKFVEQKRKDAKAIFDACKKRKDAMNLTAEEWAKLEG